MGSRVRLPGRETLKVARNWGERRSKEGADAGRGGGGRGRGAQWSGSETFAVVAIAK